MSDTHRNPFKPLSNPPGLARARCIRFLLLEFNPAFVYNSTIFKLTQLTINTLTFVRPVSSPHYSSPTHHELSSRYSPSHGLQTSPPLTSPILPYSLPITLWDNQTPALAAPGLDPSIPNRFISSLFPVPWFTYAAFWARNFRIFPFLVLSFLN